MSAGENESLEQKIVTARELLDAHVREIVHWHFHPDTGTPFWVDYAKSLDFDPLKDVHTYDDLVQFGHFQDEWLRGGPIRRWVPKALADRGISVFETGGTTGVPKSRISIDDFRIDYEQFSDRLEDKHFPRGSDWLHLGPSGPRRLRLSIEHLAQHRGGICFMVDLDPRWVNQLVRDNRMKELESYKDHLIRQALTTLRAHDGIQCLFTTPKLLEALCQKIDLKRAGIKGIFCGGTEMNEQFHRFAREELVPGVEFVPTYGNTLMGLAFSLPFDPDVGYAITYYPPHPRAIFDIVDFDDATKKVGYGETGRVMLTTLTKEFFMPRFLERDEGERAEPKPAAPWDGVSNLRLLNSLTTKVAVGVY